MWSHHIDLLEDLFYDYVVFLLERFAQIFYSIPFRKICFFFLILESFLLGVAFFVI